MTQIKKTLGIAGIIAMVGAPAMAEIASTDYVQSIVNNMIPKTGTVGHVLKKTATGLEWAAAPTPTLETTTGQSTTATMTQKAITDALDAKLSNNANTEGAIAIGKDAQATVRGAIQLGEGTNNEAGLSVGFTYWNDGVDDWDTMNYQLLDGYGIIPIGRMPLEVLDALIAGSDGFGAVYLGGSAQGSYSTAIGYGARTSEGGAIQLGWGTNDTPTSLNVGFGHPEDDGWDGDSVNYRLLNYDGVIPYERFASTMPDDCKASDGQKCALVVTWDSAQNKFTQSWEVVKVSE